MCRAGMVQKPVRFNLLASPPTTGFAEASPVAQVQEWNKARFPHTQIVCGIALIATTLEHCDHFFHSIPASVTNPYQLRNCTHRSQTLSEKIFQLFPSPLRWGWVSGNFARLVVD